MRAASRHIPRIIGPRTWLGKGKGRPVSGTDVRRSPRRTRPVAFRELIRNAVSSSSSRASKRVGVCEAYSSRPLRGHATKGTRRHWNARGSVALCASRVASSRCGISTCFPIRQLLSDPLNTDAQVFLFLIVVIHCTERGENRWNCRSRKCSERDIVPQRFYVLENISDGAMFGSRSF